MSRLVPLRRVAPGLYETRDGAYEVGSYRVTAAEAGGYGAGVRWYWCSVGRPPEDVYDTKRDAVAALTIAIASEVQS